MNWDKVQDNFDLIVAKCAEMNGTPVSPIIADTVRDTITAMQANAKEFGGLEKIACAAIARYGETEFTQPAPQSEPVKAPKTKAR